MTDLEIRNIRPLMKWKSFGIEGKGPILVRYIDELDSDHIRNILYDGGIPNHYQLAFKQILMDRENG